MPLLLLGACASVYGYENPVEGGTTQVVSNQWTVPLPWMMVGSNSQSNRVEIVDNGRVDNQIGIIGANQPSQGNSVLVSGPDAVWNNTLELQVGDLGASNRLEVANGGQVQAASATIGNRSVGNQVDVSGTGSVLDADILKVGQNGIDNELNISNGGRVQSDKGTLGDWILSDGNCAIVSGEGSVWTNTGNLNVGDSGSDNHLSVHADGRVDSSVINLGVQTLFSSNNMVSVSGNGALLNAPELNIGGTATTAGGSGNRVEVSSGGTVATTDLTIHTGNNLDLNEGGTFAVHNDFNASRNGFNFNSGGTLEVGGNLTGMNSAIEDRRTLVMNGSNAVWNKTGSSVYVGQNTSGNSLWIEDHARVEGNNMLIGSEKSSLSNRVVVSGSGSRLNVLEDPPSTRGGPQVTMPSGYLFVGMEGCNNSLEVLDGAGVEDLYGIVGGASSALNNWVQVSGAGSQWHNSKGLYLGGWNWPDNLWLSPSERWNDGGTGNSLTVEDGGWVLVGDVDTNNLPTIGMSGGLVVGDVSGNAELIAANQSVIDTGYAFVGLSSNESGTVTLTGGTEMLVRDSLTVGYAGANNTLIVSDGATLNTRSGTIGYGKSANENTAIVSGGSWTNSGSLVVGQTGSSNELFITDGGQVKSAGGTLGFAEAADGNSVTVSGLGSVWNASEDLSIPPINSNIVYAGASVSTMPVGLNVGDQGSYNRLVVSNGGRVESLGGTIGRGAMAFNNVATVTGEGSIWDNHSQLNVGYNGSGNTLRIEDGGSVLAFPGISIGYGEDANGNQGVVSGEGSTLNSGWYSQSGTFPPGIIVGPVFTNFPPYISFSTDGDVAIANEIIGDPSPFVLEPVSIMGSLGTLVVGRGGSGNSLLIEEGAQVFSMNGVIGQQSNACNNAVSVVGSNSVWHNQHDLSLGGRMVDYIKNWNSWEWRIETAWADGGTGNSLTIQDGGWVLVGDVDTNNLPNIGTSGGLVVGDASGNAELIAANQSVIDTGYAILGLSSNESGTVTLTGGTEMLVRDSLTVGHAGSGSTMTISDGATLNIGEVIASSGGRINNGSLVVGLSGSSNELFITDGGRVESSGGTIGLQAGASGNRVQVAGQNSIWKANLGGETALVTMDLCGSGGTVIYDGPFIVGDSGSNNRLEILDGGSVLADDSVIGYGASATNNLVQVAGSNSLWQAGSHLHVGKYGGNNALVIEEGGVVSSQSGNVGFASSDNEVLVSGTGSRWEISSGIIVPSTNSPIVFDPALDFDFSGYGSLGAVNHDMGWGDDVLAVGRSGSRNVLRIENGGAAYSRFGSLGFSGGNSNRVEVLGPDSLWRCDAGLFLGGRMENVFASIGSVTNSSTLLYPECAKVPAWIDGGSDNSLTISNGGWVMVGRVDTNNLPSIGTSGGLVVGDASGVPQLIAANQSVIDTGYAIVGLSSNESGSVILTSDSEMIVRDKLYVGHDGSGSTMTVSDGATLNTGAGFLGHESSASGNEVNIDGGTWNNSGVLLVGFNGSESGLFVTNGGVVSATETIVGVYSSNNAVRVSGAGSVLNSGKLCVGDKGSHNELTVADGGSVVSTYSAIGDAASASGNLVTVSGGSWSISEALAIGMAGSENALSVTDGGVVTAVETVIGVHSSSNAVQVSGAGSVLNSGKLFVGDKGSSNVLIVADGGSVVSSQSYIGDMDSSTGNLARVSGGSWSNSDVLAIGVAGSENGLSVTDGGSVAAAETFIGVFSSNNTVRVSGAGSVLNSDKLVVGDEGVNNALTIADGGSVESDGGTIGFSGSAVGNSVTVSGAGSVWDAYETPILSLDNSNIPYMNDNGYTAPVGLTVGDQGSHNRLVVFDGGRVESAEGTIGRGAAASNNVVTVTGAGSTWESRGLLNVGYNGSGNTLRIDDGGSVLAFGFTMGLAEGADGNQVIVSGEGSTLSSGLSSLPISIIPPYNTTFSTDDAAAVASDVITGPIFEPGSTFASWGDLVVGQGGSGNSLLIEDGALVSSRAGVIGQQSTAWNNAVSVAGQNSEWRIQNDLSLGGKMVHSTRNGNTLEWIVETVWADGGRGNSLYVGDGGLVEVGRDLHNRNYSGININPGSQINVASNYYQDATSSLRFGVETNVAGAPLMALMTVGGAAEFEEGATFEVASNVGALEFDTVYTNKVIEADLLIVAGVTNANSLDLKKLNAVGTLVDVLFWEEDQNIYSQTGRKHLVDVAGFDANSMMARLSLEMEDLSLVGNAPAAGMFNVLNTMSSQQQSAQLTQLYTQGVPTYMHSRGMQGGQQQVMTHARAFRSIRQLREKMQGEEVPEATVVPDQEGHGLRGWMQGYGSWADHEGSSSFSGFDQSIYGTIVGMDKRSGNVLVGAAGGYSQSNLNQDNGDSSDAKTRFGILYATVVGEEWFGDVNVSYGRSRIKTRTGTQFDAKSKSDANNCTIYVGGGREIHLSDGGLILTPEAALSVDYFNQDSYSDGIRNIDATDRWSYQSRLGAALALQKKMGAVVLKPELHAYWLHEFNTDIDQVGFSQVGGAGRYAFSMQAPDEDVLEAGVGISTLFNERVEFILGVDGQFTDSYEAVRVSGRLSIDF